MHGLPAIERIAVMDGEEAQILVADIGDELAPARRSRD